MRANKRGKPKHYKAPLTIKCSDGIVRAVTTWPYRAKLDKHGKRTGDQEAVPGMLIDGKPA